MTSKLGAAIKEINGFTIHEIFVLGENEEYISVGYGFFNPEGKLINAFPEYESALDCLEEITAPKLKPIRP